MVFSKVFKFREDQKMYNNVLYRKYRPKNYKSVIGQKINIQILKNIVINNEGVHALLFCGTRGTGKTTLAKIFAQSLLCENFKKENDVCGICNQCIKQNNYSIIEIDAASNNGIDEVRSIRDNIEIGTDTGKKIYIIDEVHMFSKSAFNALLKTIEEPPPNVYFILATTEEEKIPETIISRCLKLDFKLNNSQELKNHFEIICQKEKILINSMSIDLIVENSNNSIRDGLSLLEKVKMYLSQTEEEIGEEEVSLIIGAIPSSIINNLVKSIQKQDDELLDKQIKKLSTQTFNYQKLIEQLLVKIHEANFSLALEKELYELYLNIKNIHSSNLFILKLELIFKTNIKKTNNINQTNVKPAVSTVYNANTQNMSDDKHQITTQERVIHKDISEILSDASKDNKKIATNKINNLKNYNHLMEYVHVIKCINEKCEVVAASNNGIVFSAFSDAVAEYLKENKKLVDQLISTVYNYDIAYHVLVDKDWIKTREKYIQEYKLKKQIEKARQDLNEVFNGK